MKAGDFKKKTTQQHRKEESDHIRDKYPDRVPVVIEQGGCWDKAPLDKAKYLVPCDVTAYHLQHILRKRIKMSDRESIFLFCGPKLIKSDVSIKRLYDSNKEQDGFLYITYSQESVFGGLIPILPTRLQSHCP